MIALLGGSLFLVVLSSVALLLGWVDQNQWLIFTSIAASVAAAVFLSLAYARGKTDPLGTRSRSRRG
ncbi:MAG: hypothetical protein ACR2LG_11170 [Actinomycetota bacterium]|nr:hypothetical protein [Actinomycetota bacterium]